MSAFDAIKFIDRGIRSEDAGKLPGPTDDFWYEPTGGAATLSGVRITPTNAMQVTTVYACVRIMSDIISTLPLDMYRRTGAGVKEKYPNHPLQELLKYQPNNWQSGSQFWNYLITSCCLRGAGYAEIEINGRGQISQLIPMHPDYLITEILPNRRLRYKYLDPVTKEAKILLQDEVFRLMPFSLDGMTPCSPVTLNRETIGLSLAAQQHGATSFGNGARLSGVLEANAPFKDEETRKGLEESWNRAYSRKKSNKVAVLPHGLKFEPISMTNQDAQYLDTRKFQRSDICGIYRVPPHMVGDLERATFSNIEHQSISFVTHTIRPWLVGIEQEILKTLIIAPRLYFSEFNVTGLLRGDTKTRGAYYSQSLGAGGHPPWHTVNEIRAYENLPPVDGGDEMQMPINALSGFGTPPGFDDEPDEDEEKDTDR